MKRNYRYRVTIEYSNGETCEKVITGKDAMRVAYRTLVGDHNVTDFHIVKVK